MSKAGMGVRAWRLLGALGLARLLSLLGTHAWLVRDHRRQELIF